MRLAAKRSLAPFAPLVLLMASLVHADPPVQDVVAQFERIAHHGDPLGWHLNDVAADPDVCRHYQGVVRKDGADGTPYLLLTRSGNWTQIFCDWLGDCGLWDCPGELVVVEMGSRAKHGERMGSNKYKENLSMDDSEPDDRDKAVTSVRFSGSYGLPSYRHPGSGQVAGDVFAIPLERPADPGLPDTAIVFMDVSDPTNPALIKLVPVEGGSDSLGVMGMTMDEDTGEVLILITDRSTSMSGLIFTTTMELIRDPLVASPLTEAGWWSAEDLIDPDCPFALSIPEPPIPCWMKWQSLNLIRQADGRLFLATSDESSEIGGGNDWIALYELTPPQLGTDRWTLELKTARHLYSQQPQMGDFNAAGGFYVSPMGVVMVYMGEHDNDGPGGTVKMGEFRSWHPTLIASCGGWVEMYEDNRGWDDDSPDRSVMLDWVDRDADDWDDLRAFGFNDDIDSIIWNLPQSREARFYEDTYPPSNRCLEVRGEGIATQAYLDDDNCHGDHISAVDFADDVLPPVSESEARVCPSGCIAGSVREGVLEVVTCESGGDVYIQALDQVEVYNEGYLRIGLAKGHSVRLHAEGGGTVRISH